MSMTRILNAKTIRISLLIIWLSIVLLVDNTFTLISEYAGFSLLGIIGAIFANATGAGGGVIFVPFFNQLQFDMNTTIATSLGIQCCGMTAGAITWWHFYKTQKFTSPHWCEISSALKLTIFPSIIGIWGAQFFQKQLLTPASADALHVGFGVFSIILALAIFATIPMLKRDEFAHHFSRFDLLALPLLAVVGGVITAWLSIGVGELIAVFLIIRKFNVTFAIAVAVILSAFSVWAGVLFHFLVTQAIYWPVVLFAGAGAIVGGILAKQVVLFFSAKNLKIFFAGWVLLLGISSLPLW